MGVAAFDAEAAAADNQDHAAALLDLVKAFEMVPHRLLVQAARDSGFILKVLRMSLAAYRIARVVGIDGAFSREITATRGITAGSGMATSELRLLLADTVYALKKMWPVALKLYVDDLTITASGDGLQAAVAVAEATDHAVTAFRKLGLDVSVKKSVAVANRPRVLSTMIAYCRTGALTASKTAKLLGTSFAAGSQRTVQALSDRIAKVKRVAHRAQQLSRLGLSAVDYVRSAAIPAMLYGCDTSGVSDSMLDDACRVASTALAPPTAGKNPTMVLQAAAVHSDSVNPSMTANIEPIKAWSTAWWEGWATPARLTKVYTAGNARVLAARPNHWNVVRGPAAAVAATCHRLQWKCTDGRLFRDDVGNVLDATLDPPQAFVAAARRSVIRLHLDAVVEHLPGAAPTGSDTNHHSTFAAKNGRDGGRRLVNVNLTPLLRPLYKGSQAVKRTLPQWTAKCRSYLTSALSGGQWPQARKAKLPQFVGNDLCQLCLSCRGTLTHRHACPATLPELGWTKFDDDAQAFVNGLPEARASTLQDRAFLTVALPIAEPQVESRGWVWLSEQPDPEATDLRWVIDGSRRFASDYTLSTTGCGVAVLDGQQRLVAYAYATPPPWVKTANSAEAWALLLTLKANPYPPAILTDCMGLVNAARAGPFAATRAKQADARIWKLICEASGGSFDALSAALVWMPAHTSASQACTRAKSNGRQLTTSEWRANSLADLLAKRGAVNPPARIEADKLIKLAGRALVQSAARLGVVTLAANNQRTEAVRANGEKYFITKRDSSAMPPALLKARALKAESKEAAPAPKAAQAPAPLKLPAPLQPQTALQVRSCKRRAQAVLRDSARADHVTELAAAAAASSCPQALSAAERMAALRRRCGLDSSSSPLAPPVPPPPAPLATSSAQAEDWSFLGPPYSSEHPR